MRPCPVSGSQRCAICFPPLGESWPTPVGKYEKRLLGTKPDVIVHDEIVDMGPVITPTKGENVSAVTSNIDNLKGQVLQMERSLSESTRKINEQAETIKNLQQSEVRMLLIRRDGTTQNKPCYIGKDGGPQRYYEEMKTALQVQSMWEYERDFIKPQRAEHHRYRLLDVVGKLAVYGEV